MGLVYEQIADKIREDIRAGRLGPGERLPSEADMMKETGKSAPTIRQALAVLEAEGLVIKRHGRGTFVREPRTPAVRTNLRHQWEKNRAREPEERRAQTGATEHDTGLQLNDLVFHAEYKETEADAELAEVFGVPEGTAMLERNYRTRYAAESAPFTLVTSYLVREVVAPNPDLLDAANEPWPGGTQNQLHTIGIEFDRIEEHVTARPPTPEEATELDLPRGTSVLVLRKRSYDTDDRVVEFSRVILPGDRTEMVFVTPLERW